MSNEELDSQLSAMFDDELPQGECELLARRLSRDPALKERWGRYALIGAAMRGERGLRLDSSMARRVSAALAAEPGFASGGRAPAGASRFGRWREALAGGAVAAGVAALSILWLRGQQGPEQPLIAERTGSVPAAAIVSSGEPDSYTVPTIIEQPAVVPTAELANYVVAHSEFSGPLVRRNTLSNLVASEAEAVELFGAEETQPENDGPTDAPRR